ncbi:MAG: YkgJ family cysteine cluster protein [Desulfobacteraceae bacterium]
MANQPSISMNTDKKQELFKPIEGNSFRFLCHKDIPCFTKCCAALNLVLTPYDILRIKTRLGISADDFLDRYADTRFDKHARFPMVVLRMIGDQDRRCPFVSSEGCTIYEDRPAACRIYPLGRAASKADGGKETKEKFFIVDEQHCLGLQENRLWTIEDWLADQGADTYNRINDQWLEILGSSKSLGPKEGIPRKIQMFSMASYNLDKFRKFIFESRFFELFEVGSELKDRLASDDLTLMTFSLDWLKFSLFGEKTIHLKSKTIPKTAFRYRPEERGHS